MEKVENTAIKSPIKFGSEVDFKLAIQELKWLKSTKHRITNNDYKIISEKYVLPINFLKKGISGLNFPEDFRMLNSKWFPIFYSWTIQNHDRFVNLLRVRIDFEKSHAVSRMIPIIIVIIFGGFAWILFKNNPTELLEVFVLGIILASIGLYVEYSNNAKGKKVDLDEYKRQLGNEGRENLINEVDKYIRNYGKYLVFAEDIMFRKIEEAKKLQLFPMGTKKDEEGNEIPIFYSEDIERIYYERMKTILNE